MLLDVTLLIVKIKIICQDTKVLSRYEGFVNFIKDLSRYEGFVKIQRLSR